MISAINSYYYSLKNKSLILIISIFFLSCGEDKPTEPNDSHNTDNVIATATIGTGGGIISGDGISISIPSGAFSKSENLTVLRSDSTTFDSEVITNIYKLNGFPSVFSKPLRFALKYNGSLNEESYIAFSEDINDDLLDINFTIYNLFEARDSSDFLVVSLLGEKENKNFGKINTPTNDIISFIPDVIYGRTRKALQVHESEHFIIRYPEKFYTLIPDPIITFWEDSYGFINTELGMELNDVSNNKLSVEVSTASSDDFWYTAYVSKPSVDFKVNSQKLSNGINYNSFRSSTSSNLYVKSIKDNYFPDASLLKDIWFFLTVYHWLSVKFDSDILKDFFNTGDFLAMAPFNGIMTKSLYENYDNKFQYSVGMISLINYLLEYKLNSQDLLRKKGLGNVFDLIKNGSSQPSALLNTIAQPVNEWWPDFFKHYIAGEIYSIKSDVFMASENVDLQWKIQSSIGEDSYLALTSLPDLSAKLYVIDFSEIELKPSSTFSLTLSNIPEEKINGLSTLIFALKNDHLDLIRSGQDIKINNLKTDYYDLGITKFVACVVNSNGDESLNEPFTGTTSASVELRYSEQEPMFTECYIDLDIASAYYDRNYSDGSSEQVLGLGDFSDYFDLTFDGTKYSANLNEKYQFGTDSTFTNYNISFELSDQKDRITNLTIEIESNTRSIYSNTNDPREGNYRIIKFRDIPLLSGFNDRFEIRGKETCNYIDSFIGNAFYVTYYQQTLSVWECDDESRIYIDLD